MDVKPECAGKVINLSKGVERVAYFFFFVLALFVFMIVLFFAPLGFTMRGKGLILSASLLLSAAGLGALLLMPGWQGFTAATMLSGLAAYFIAKRPEVFLEHIKMDSHSYNSQSANQIIEDSYSYIAGSVNQNPGLENRIVERLDMAANTSHQNIHPAEEWIKPAVGIAADQSDFPGGPSGWTDEYDLGERVPEDNGVLPVINFSEPLSAERDVEDDFWGSLLEEDSMIETEEPYRELAAGKS